MQAVEVTAHPDATLNSIDRKVYIVGQDIQSATGTASDLLQNVVSAQVDIDGNVSLRGDDSVQILIDGRTSSLMGANRAAVLEQMPADAIERIEVITNPSAKYKPDGTGGIINLVMKHKRDPGYSGTISVNAGNRGRYGTGVNANYNPGRFNLFGSFNLRQDDRIRIYTDQRSHFDTPTQSVVPTRIRTTEYSRPLSRIGQAGVDCRPGERDKLGAVFSYNYRTFVRHSTENDAALDGAGAVTSDYDRQRIDPEYEKDFESKTTYEHDFAETGHNLNLEFRLQWHGEQENNGYTNVYRVPEAPVTHDLTRITLDAPSSELIAEYARPLGADSKAAAGCSLSDDRLDQDYLGESQDPATGLWTVDPTVTNRFILDQAINAVYVTYSRTDGPLGLLAGARFEQSIVDTDQVTAAIAAATRYFRLYPTIHLSYDLTDTRRLQLNYSHRVRRPRGDDLNPYPQYQDPYNLNAGNPRLRPEETHSIEAGWEYHRDERSLLATAYYRYTYHGFTDVSRYITPTTLLTTKENLAENQSGGLELSGATEFGAKFSLNASGSAYYSQIAASNLGFSTAQSTWACAGKLNANYTVSKTTLVQFNCNYTGKRLTAQGYRLPTFVANLGLRRNLPSRNLALVLTVSDLFNSLKEETRIDTAVLRDDSTRRRSSRIVYAGVIYTFGKAKKKPKDDSLPFDNQL